MAQASQQVVTPSQSNSTADYLTQLVQDRDDLVTNLTTKGITGLTGDETFTELVPEVLNISGGSGHDWSAIGYSGEPQTIQEGYDYAKTIYDNWVPSDSYWNKYLRDYNLIFMPLVNTSSCTNYSGMFAYCYSLVYVPQLNTSNATIFGELFNYCYSLRKVEELDAGKVNKTIAAFQYCYSLTHFGGFKDLGKAYSTTSSANNANYTLGLSYSNNLTHDSLMNVINNLYDIATAGVQTQKLILGSTNLAKLSSAEIAIATNKGWAVS